MNNYRPTPTPNPKTREQKLQDLEMEKLKLEIILLKAKIGELTPAEASELVLEMAPHGLNDVIRKDA